MSRTTVNMLCRNHEAASKIINAILTNNGYKPVNENGEVVWKNGIGLMTAMKYIKVEYVPTNVVVVSGWIRAVIGGEDDLDGFVGVIPKTSVKNVMDEIQRSII